MRKQIAAANWKMNLNLHQSIELIHALQSYKYDNNPNHEVIIAVPFPFLIPVAEQIQTSHFKLAAQNVAATADGAYTGEVSAAMLKSIGIEYAIIGHSERRSYYHEDPELLLQKVEIALKHEIRPIFCCGEPLEIREAGSENTYVANQLKASLFHLDKEVMEDFIIAYEPIWAIGTGKTASADQAEEMHAFIRKTIAEQYGDTIADSVSILYGGSVKAANAREILGKPNVDGGLVGGASLNAAEFSEIIMSLK